MVHPTLTGLRRHTLTHSTGGNTCSCNLAPLCRRHHRLKTHAGWTYAVVEPGVFIWREPHGQRFLRNHAGTYDVTPPENFRSPEPDTWNGYRAGPEQLASWPSGDPMPRTTSQSPRHAL